MQTRMNRHGAGQVVGNARDARYTSAVMANTVTGLLQGTTITLDAPVPPLDGQRVRVIVEPATEEVSLPAAENAKLWAEWIARGPQGPIELDGDDNIAEDE